MMARSFFVALAISAPLMGNLAFGSMARAQSAQDTASKQDIASQLPGIAIKPGKNGALALGSDFRPADWRALPSGFELSLHTNGVDDESWPLEKIISGLAARPCGQVSQAAVQQQIERLYKSKSLTKPRELGGNAGETFRRRLTGKLGQCNVTYNAEGARWHTITVQVQRP